MSEETDAQFARFTTFLDPDLPYGGQDPGHLRRGRLGAFPGADGGFDYFTVPTSGEEGAGLYDDISDYNDYPWAYPEHPEFESYWGSPRRQQSFVPPEVRQSVLSTLGSEPLIEDTNQSPLPTVSDVSEDKDKLDASTESALQQIKKTPSLSFVDAARQNFLEDEDEEPLSFSQSKILKSFLEQTQNQRVQDSPAFQQQQQAIASILKTNPGFLSRPLQQITSANVEQTEPKFTNILEEIETDPVEALQQTTTPTDFVRTFEEVDGGGFDEDGKDSFTSTTSLGDAFGGLFGEEDSEPAFGDFSSAQMSQAAQTITQAETTFSNEQSNMPTPAEIAAAQAEGKFALAATMQAERAATLLATKAGIFAEKTPVPETLATALAQNIAEGFVIGANPALAAPIAGGFFTPAGLITAPVVAGINAAIDVANSPYEGFTAGNFFSALFNGLTFGLFGESVEDQENKQEELDLLAEDVFSNPFLSPKETLPEFGKLVNTQTKTIQQIQEDIANAIISERTLLDEQELDIQPGEGSFTGMGNEGLGHSFGDPFDTGFDDTSEDGPGGSGSGSGDDGGAGSACWVAGTQILMADNTYRNIEDLKIGDMVMSYPETKKTRRWNTPLEARPIVSLLVDVHPEIWHLNDSMVSGTEWMIKGDGTAAIVQWLNVGDTVLGPDNNLVEITRVEPAEGHLKKQVIYNFETENNYTYIADGMRTIRGRAVRGEQWGKAYLSGDTNSYEGSMKDEYVRKFDTIKNAA